MASEFEAHKGGSAGKVSLDDLIALNDEIAALSRSGMPLERGLLDLGGDLRGRLGKVTRALGARLERGETLSEALGAPEVGAPRVYRAVVEAGLRAGRLPAALEGLAAYARAFAEARQSVALALAYPLMVFCLAYALFVFAVVVIVPRFLGAFDSLGLPVHQFLRGLGGLGRLAPYWGPVFPVLFVAWGVVWFASRRASALGGGRARGALRWFPWLGSMMKGYEAAGFADLLALLLANGVPYPEALVLAGEASGDPVLASAGRALAGRVVAGGGGAALRGAGLPPMLLWVLEAGPAQGDLVAALRQMADRYRSLARFQAEKLRVALPTVLLFAIGVSSCLVYALAIFVPLTTLWDSLALQAP